MLAVKQWNVRNGLRLLNITRWVQQFRNSIEYKYNIIEQKWSEGFLLILAAFPDKIILFQFSPQVETRAGSKVYDSDVLWLEQEIVHRSTSLNHRTSSKLYYSDVLRLKEEIFQKLFQNMFYVCGILW